jgi:hypothetical protein
VAVGSRSVATSKIHRAPPPSESEASTLGKDFSLQGRLDAALAPDATDSERDALLYAISRPLPPEASPREHADFLLSLLMDEHSHTLKGSTGRTVKQAAVQALLALGYPYALEIPPELLELPTVARSLRARLWWGKVLSMANALGLPLVATWLSLRTRGSAAELKYIPIWFGISGACALLPTALILLGRKWNSLPLKVMGSLGHILSGLAAGALVLFVLSFAPYDPDFSQRVFLTAMAVFGVLQFVTTALLQAPQSEE